MRRKRLLTLLAALFSLSLLTAALPCHAVEEAPPEASVNGTYSGLLQVMYCPNDRGSYGTFRDYGKWGGGPWCGQTGKAGYWVWVAPNWYVWKNKGRPQASQPAVTGEENVPDKASANGRYGKLLQVMHCPQDRNSYGEFRDYGYWGGGPWCGQTGRAGYWVWLPPNWYIWERQN